MGTHFHSQSMFTTIAGLSGAAAIGFGAFGAHALRGEVTDERIINAFTTGAHYHLAHSVALLALGNDRPTTQTLWVIGIVLFSGSLYCLPINRKLGAITPIG